MANIGDLFFSLLADGSKLTQSVVKEAEKAGDAGAKSLNQRMAAGLRTAGMKAFGVAASGAFAIATKGALELENAQAEIAAQTGLNAEQAKEVALAANRIAGEQRTSLEAVRDIAIAVHNDLGLTGAAAEAMTGKIAEFARVTHQDGVGAVTALDDITDAYNLSVEDQATVLDKLLVSQQRYGGSITANADSLSKLAPQLVALNATYDDGIALLNIFAASGVDAAKAQGALNFAVKKLKPGQGLDDLVAQVTAIEDPTARAQKAIELFGSKGGVALANALKPGVDSLDDFAVSAEDSAGAVDKAADAIDSTFSGRIQKAISIAQAKLREFGAAVGPALTGLASIGTFVATAFPGIGQKAGEKLAGGIGAAMAKTTLISSGIARAIELIPGAGAVKGAITAAGTKIGTMLGISASAAFAAAAVVAVAAVAWVANDQQQKIDAMGDDLLRQAEEFKKVATDQDLAKAIEGTKEELDKLPGNAFDSRNKVVAVINSLVEEQNRRATAGGAEAGLGYTDGFAEGVVDGAPAAGDAAAGALGKEADGLAGAAGAAGTKAGRKVDENFAAGVLERQDRVTSAFDDLKNLMKNALGRGERIAETIGILTSERLAKGLHDRRGAVRAQAQFVQQDAEERLARMIQAGGKVGEKAMEELKKGLHSKNPEVRAAAQRVKEIVDGKLDDIPPKAGKVGTAAGQALADKLKAQLIAAQGQIAAALKNLFGGGSSTGGGGGGGGAKKKAIGGAVRAGQPTWVNEHTPRSELMVPSTGGHVLTHAAAMQALSQSAGGGGGDTFNIPIHLTGVLRAETPADVTTRLQQLANTGVISSRRQRSTMRVPTRG